jgi:hypothetical protein
MRHKRCRPPSHRAAAEQFDLFGLLCAYRMTVVSSRGCLALGASAGRRTGS